MFSKILYLRILEAFLQMRKLGTYKNLMLIRTMGNNTFVLLTLCAVTVYSGQFGLFLWIL